MYKKVILLSLLFSIAIFAIDKLFFVSKSSKIPDPEIYIVNSLKLLQNNDVKAYKASLPTKELYEYLLKEKFELNQKKEYSFGSADEFMEMLNQGDGFSYYDLQMKFMLEEFEDAYKKGVEYNLDWNKIEIVNITWKLAYDKLHSAQFYCNSKIFFKCKNEDFILKYKEMFYHKGQWYPGRFVSLNKLNDEIEFIPDLSGSPAEEENLEYEEAVEEYSNIEED